MVFLFSPICSDIYQSWEVVTFAVQRMKFEHSRITQSSRNEIIVVISILKQSKVLDSFPAKLTPTATKVPEETSLIQKSTESEKSEKKAEKRQ